MSTSLTDGAEKYRKGLSKNYMHTVQLAGFWGVHPPYEFEFGVHTATLQAIVMTCIYLSRNSKSFEDVRQLRIELKMSAD